MLSQEAVAGWRREVALMDPEDRTSRRVSLERQLGMSPLQRRGEGYRPATREQLEVALAVLIEAGA